MDPSHRESTFHSRQAIGLLGLFAFGVCFYSGLRGIFPLDQSIVFDGAYRVLRGEIIYRDFVAPYGPIVFWWQALMFKLAGLNYYAYALGAAILNVMGTLCAFHIVRTLFRGRWWLAVGAGALTAVWLCAPFGTTYPEQTAFCLLLAAMSLILSALSPSDGEPLARGVESRVPATRPSLAAPPAQYRDALKCFVAGLLAAIAVLAKHNAGLLAVGVCLATLIVFAAPRWKSLAGHLVWFAAGGGICCMAFVVWVQMYSDWGAFYDQVVELPRRLGSQRLLGSGMKIFLRGLLTGKGSDEIRILLVLLGLLSACVVGLGVLNWRRLDDADRNALRAAALGMLLLAFQNTFSLVSSNDGTNEKPFLGVLFAICGGLIAYLRSKQRDVVPGTASAAHLHARSGEWVQIPRWTLWVLPVIAAGFSYWLYNGIAIAGTLVAALLTDSLGCFRVPGEGSWEDRIRSPLSPGFVTIGTRVAFVYLLAVGGIVSVARQVHESFWHYHRIPHVFVFSHHSTFQGEFDEPALRGLRWGEPTKVGEKHVTASDLRELMAHLRDRGGNFFTFPDFTFLYAALNRPSPQPLLWFHPGLTYPVEYTPEIDRRVVAALDDNQVRTIVLEGDNFFGTTQLDNFPELRIFIEQQFDFDRRIGIFSVYHRGMNRGSTGRPGSDTATVAPDVPR